MQEPFVRVGIMSDKNIRFQLNGVYRSCGTQTEGSQQVALQEDKISWNGGLYDELLFEATDGQSTFTLKDVTIGINFHWERKEDQRFQGSLKFIIESGAITAINLIKTEDYLTSVISSEMSSTASLELLKAHAVISRSWLLNAINNSQLTIDNEHTKQKTTDKSTANCQLSTVNCQLIKWYDREDHLHFDVCADDHCQRYQGVSRAYDNIEQVKKAIESTRGEVLSYQGGICDTRFSKCCGGVVEEFQNCWEDIRFPYLAKVRDAVDSQAIPDLTINAEAVQWIKGRPDAFCNTTDRHILSQVLNNYDQETTDFYRWSISYTQEELSELFKRRSGIDVGTINELIPLERGTSGRIVRLFIKGSKKDFIIGKELEIRRTLSESHLYSSAFYVERQGDTFTLHGAGWGHGVGLCQIGAAVMGEQGYTYDKILTHYYPGAEINKLW